MDVGLCGDNIFFSSNSTGPLYTFRTVGLQNDPPAQLYPLLSQHKLFLYLPTCVYVLLWYLNDVQQFGARRKYVQAFYQYIHTLIFVLKLAYQPQSP